MRVNLRPVTVDIDAYVDDFGMRITVVHKPDLKGSGPPDDSLGVNGNYYQDTDNNGLFYGPKESGVWGSGFTSPIPLDLSDRTWAAMARQHRLSSQKLFDFDVDDSDSENGVLLIQATTEQLRSAYPDFVYDIEGTPLMTERSDTIITGSIALEMDVTRADADA